MKLRELYTGAIAQNYYWLCLLIEFLVLEKEVLSFEDNVKELDLYFKPNNRKRMNYLLLEYQKKVG